MLVGEELSGAGLLDVPGEHENGQTGQRAARLCGDGRVEAWQNMSSDEPSR